MFCKLFARVILFVLFFAPTVYANWEDHEIPSPLPRNPTVDYLIRGKKEHLTQSEKTQSYSKAKKEIKFFAFSGDPTAMSIYIEGKIKGKYGFKMLTGSQQTLFLEIMALKGYAKARHYIFRGLLRGEHEYREKPEEAWRRLENWKDKGDVSFFRQYGEDYENALKNLKSSRLLNLKINLIKFQHSRILKRLFDDIVCVSFRDLDLALKEVKYNKTKFVNLKNSVEATNDSEDSQVLQLLNEFFNTVTSEKYDLSIQFSSKVQRARERALRYLDLL